jgi:hypothetical protein
VRNALAGERAEDIALDVDRKNGIIRERRPVQGNVQGGGGGRGAGAAAPADAAAGRGGAAGRDPEDAN